jgi:hypothetical protein
MVNFRCVQKAVSSSNNRTHTFRPSRSLLFDTDVIRRQRNYSYQRPNRTVLNEVLYHVDLITSFLLSRRGYSHIQGKIKGGRSLEQNSGHLNHKNKM